MNAELKEKNIAVYEAEGQALGAVGAIVTLIVGVGVSVMVLIFVGALGGQTYNLVESSIDEIGNNTANMNSFIANNLTATSLNHTYIHTGELVIFNATGSNIVLTNFTIDYTAGTALLIGSPTLNGTTLYANYTYGDYAIRTDIKSGITSGFSALKQTGDYLPIIVLAVVISLVMFLVLGMTGMGMGGGGSRTAL